MDSQVVWTVVTMPLNVVFWAWLVSFPLRFYFKGRAQVIASLAASLAIMEARVIVQPDLGDKVQIAGAITALGTAILCYVWWLRRSRRQGAGPL